LLVLVWLGVVFLLFGWWFEWGFGCGGWGGGD